MNDSVRLGRIAGVRVGLHWSLLIMVGRDGLRKIAQEDAALDLRLRDLAVHLVAEVRVSREGCNFGSQKMSRPWNVLLTGWRK